MSFIGFSTTHTGSLPRPPDVARLVFAAAEAGMPAAADEDVLGSAVTDVVEQQRRLGLGRMNDGEITRLRYWDVFTKRVDGIEPFADDHPSRAATGRFAGYEPPLLSVPAYPVPSERLGRMPVVRGPLVYRGPVGLDAEVDRLRTALGADPGFLTAPSPGMLALTCRDDYYRDEELLLAAAARVLAEEYRFVADSGLVLQVDSPDLPVCLRGHPAAEGRATARLRLDALRRALQGISAEQVRLHVCWGNSEGPHDEDVELQEFADLLLAMPVGALVLEAANPRHAHEWRLWGELDLGDKQLIVGAIDTTTNFVEHPDLVADRLCQFASVVDPSRLVAGTDCGFGTWAHFFRVHPSVAWAKLESLVEGARRASRRLTAVPA